MSLTLLRLNGIHADAIWNPPIKGFNRFKAGTWAFLIEHPSSRKLLYDLGLRKDWKPLPPRVGLREAVIMGVIADITVKKNIAQILVEAGVKLRDRSLLLFHALRDTIRRVEQVDAASDIFTLLAHDWSLKGLIDEFPGNLNAWKEKG
jgi:hypothetical protein